MQGAQWVVDSAHAQYRRKLVQAHYVNCVLFHTPLEIAYFEDQYPVHIYPILLGAVEKYNLRPISKKKKKKNNCNFGLMYSVNGKKAFTIGCDSILYQSRPTV